MHRFVALFLALVAAACTPTQAVRGNMVEDFRLAEVTPGISTRQNVLVSLGSPTTQAPFNENVWYYMGQRTEKTGIFDPEVVEEKIVVVSFDEEGIVQTAEVVDADRIDIPRVRDKTPTGGNDITAVQQIMGNLGRFNKPLGDPGR
jgi:outer membrane protein assembly factor BamE (lipoprotein component of BamABCDE complex)